MSQSIKRSRLVGLGSMIGLGAAVLLAGCGTLSTTAAAHAPATKAKQTTKTKHAAPSVSVPVKIGIATVSGKREQILENPKGFALYYFSKDTATVSHCTGKCAAIWPPLLATTAKIQAPKGLSGPLTIVKDVHGRQIAYKGHLLYLYAPDKKPGETLGQGILKEWWVATPSMPAITAGVQKSTTKSTKSTKSTSGGSSSGSGW
ncbi:MAG: hypothetical protein OWU84_12355 [Firmicutes bacterium]|nr:hypothetical protein [Bacillota bacterium]